MILGFAHLTINVGDVKTAEGDWISKGYERKALFCDVPNHHSKSTFTHSHQSLHDIMLLDGKGLVPLELTCHGEVTGINQILEWTLEHISLSVPHVAAISGLLESALGFKREHDGLLALTSRFPNWGCKLLLKKGVDEMVRLDAAGGTTLAFYSNRIEEDTKKIQNAGAVDQSGVFELDLGERNLLISLMRIPHGPLLELIQPRKS